MDRHRYRRGKATNRHLCHTQRKRNETLQICRRDVRRGGRGDGILVFANGTSTSIHTSVVNKVICYFSFYIFFVNSKYSTNKTNL